MHGLHLSTPDWHIALHQQPSDCNKQQGCLMQVEHEAMPQQIRVVPKLTMAMGRQNTEPTSASVRLLASSCFSVVCSWTTLLCCFLQQLSRRIHATYELFNLRKVQIYQVNADQMSQTTCRNAAHDCIFDQPSRPEEKWFKQAETSPVRALLQSCTLLVTCEFWDYGLAAS